MLLFQAQTSEKLFYTFSHTVPGELVVLICCHFALCNHLIPYTQDAWVGQIPKVVLKKQDFNDASISNQKQNYSHVYDQPLRKADPSSDYFRQSRAQRDEFDYPRKDLPYPVYPEARQYR
ncbi:hypothetical protein Nmel_012935, partial [Mimus melanotis]